MSMHKKPLTKLEREGLEKHHLPIGTPSVTADCFRAGMAWVFRNSQHVAEVAPGNGCITVKWEQGLNANVRNLQYGDKLYTAPKQLTDASGLLEASKHILAILKHPTNSVTILDAGKLEDAIQAYEDQISSC